MMDDDDFVKLAATVGIPVGPALALLRELEARDYCIAHDNEIDGG